MNKDDALKKKHEYARAVCVFLADGLRSRRIPLQHAAEIAEKVVENINLIDSEEDFLKFVKNLASDFEELAKLEERIYMRIRIDERKELEAKVRDYVVRMIESDLEQSVRLLEEAVKNGSTLHDLVNKFPRFKKYLEDNPQ